MSAKPLTRWLTAWLDEQPPEIFAATLQIAATLVVCATVVAGLIAWRPQVWMAAVGMGCSLAAIAITLQGLLSSSDR